MELTLDKPKSYIQWSLEKGHIEKPPSERYQIVKDLIERYFWRNNMEIMDREMITHQLRDILNSLDFETSLDLTRIEQGTSLIGEVTFEHEILPNSNNFVVCNFTVI